MDIVSFSIFRTLTEGCGITMPGIGSLYVRPYPSTMLRPGRIIPPGRRIIFSSDEDPNLQNIITKIALTEHISEENANEIYRQWQNRAVSDKTITIDGVGKIENGNFKPAKDLESILKPFGHEMLRLKKVGHKSLTYAITAALIIILAGAGFSWYKGYLSCIGIPSVAELMNNYANNHPAHIVPEASHKPQQVVADTIATGTAVPPSAEDSITRSLIAGVTDSNASTDKTDGQQQTSNLTTGQQDIYHVVGGVYSNETNADKFIAKSRIKNDTLIYVKLPSSRQRVIVSIYQTEDRQKALKVMRKLDKGRGSLWVYTQHKTETK